MKLKSDELAKLMAQVAKRSFRSRLFSRRELMDATEKEVKKQGFWTSDDNAVSGSKGEKSRGLAAIDYRFSDLVQRRALISEGRNVWRLATSKPPTLKETRQSPSDLPKPPPRYKAEVSRIIRDTKLARKLKKDYRYACQVCGQRFELSNGLFYIEAHHIRPLGGRHDGLDTSDNILVLCPNHHAMFDYGIPRFLSPQRIKIAGKAYDLTLTHELSQESIVYHNTKLRRSKA